MHEMKSLFTRNTASSSFNPYQSWPVSTTSSQCPRLQVTLISRLYMALGHEKIVTPVLQPMGALLSSKVAFCKVQQKDN
jgi:hypothetical protein